GITGGLNAAQDGFREIECFERHKRRERVSFCGQRQIQPGPSLHGADAIRRRFSAASGMTGLRRREETKRDGAQRSSVPRENRSDRTTIGSVALATAAIAATAETAATTTAAAAETTATAAAAEAATRALFLGTGFVDRQLTATELGAIDLLGRGL